MAVGPVVIANVVKRNEAICVNRKWYPLVGLRARKALLKKRTVLQPEIQRFAAFWLLGFVAEKAIFCRSAFVAAHSQSAPPAGHPVGVGNPTYENIDDHL